MASTDWLTNKVDRSVSGRVARQQCVGPLQLPLSDVAAVMMDYADIVFSCTSFSRIAFFNAIGKLSNLSRKFGATYDIKITSEVYSICLLYTSRCV